MPVYQPNAIVGNSRVLISLGAKAELMSFFYPHIDFPQNLHEGMPAVYFPPQEAMPESVSQRLVWTFDPSWEASQRYLPRTNIVETQLRHKNTGLALKVTDVVHPSEPLFLRRFEASNPTNRALSAKIFQYLDLQLGEIELKNAVHFHPDRAVAVAYWRNICFAVGAVPFDDYGCGRAMAGSPTSAKRQMERGSLNHQPEEIGDIDLAFGWLLNLRPGQHEARDLIIAVDSNERAAVERVEAARDLGWDALFRWSRSRWDEFIQRAEPVDIEPDLRDAYHRCLLGIDLLADRDTGSILAAPEFDPFFERSGGYGFCWPRDAVEVCLAMEMAGYPEYLARLFPWTKRTQRPEGYWEQRYWLSGERGPAWCTAAESLQIDQTASVLFAMGRHARRLDDVSRVAFLEGVWDSAERAARFLVDNLSPQTGLHVRGFDLWETFRGSFTYSNAAIAMALREAAFLARQSGKTDLGDRWEATASRMKQTIMSRLRLNGIFARGIGIDGELDTAADAAALGLITPFGLLDLQDATELKIARDLVEGLVQRLGSRSDSAETLLRFEHDQYAGGGPGALATLWLARSFLHLALACREKDPGASMSYRRRAVASMRAVLRAGTSTGLLPEMMGVSPGGYWAVPHAWTMASFVMAALLLHRLTADPNT